MGDVSANEAKGASFMTQAKWPGSACALADARVALREAAEWPISLFCAFLALTAIPTQNDFLGTPLARHP